MKRSQFNIIAQKEGEKRCLIFNTFHDSQVLFEDKDRLHQFLKKIDSHTALDHDEEEIASSFLELGFLVEDENDERQTFLQWFDEKIRNNYERLSSLILTSRTCNLRCPYCFEKDVLDQGLNMKEETADQVIRWLSQRIEKYHPKIVDITFFGGEPLMNVPVLKRIASTLSSLCKENDVEFEFGMITNGVLLTAPLVRELKTMGLKWVKITIDGDKAEHDTLRITASGKGTFDKIWGNLEKLKNLVPIYIGGNFDQRNEESLHHLVDKLGEASFRPNLFSVEFKPIQNELKESQHDRPIRTDLAEPAFNTQQIEIMKQARAYIQKKGLPTNKQIGIGPCELHRKSFFGIDMDGDLYKCSAMVGRKDFASGNIWEGQDEKKVDERMGTGIRPWKDCGTCPFIPVCAGGCKAVGYNRTGDFTVGSCDKVYFRSMVQEMFERNLEEDTPYGDGLQIEQAFQTGDDSFSEDISDQETVPDESIIEGVRSFLV